LITGKIKKRDRWCKGEGHRKIREDDFGEKYEIMKKKSKTPKQQYTYVHECQLKQRKRKQRWRYSKRIKTEYEPEWNSFVLVQRHIVSL
jgi:hypothetical protein